MKKDISLRVKKSGEGTLSPACDLTIEKAEELKAVLLNALDRSNNLVVNHKKLTGADLTCIQLFCSANRTFQKENKGMTIKDLTSEDVLTKVFLDNGFTGSRCMSEDLCKKCLWEEVLQDD